MPEFTLVKGGQEYVVRNVNNEWEAVEKFNRMIGGRAPKTQQPKQEDEGFLHTLAGFLPGVQTKRAFEGDTTGAEKASAVAGDIGSLAGMGAAVGAGAAAGMSAPELAVGIGAPLVAGAGAQYLLKKTGAEPALRETAGKIRETKVPGDVIAAAGRLLTNRPSQGDNILLNFLGQALQEASPTGAVANVTEMLPMLATSAVMGKAAKMAPSPARMGSRMVAAAEPSRAIQDIEKYGGQPTPAASGGRMAKTLEFSARSNPLTAWMFKDKDAANIAAAQKFAESEFGPDIKMGVRPAIGETMKGLLDELAGRRQAKYQPAVEALEKAGGFPGYAKGLLQELSKQADALNVTPSSKKAFMSAAIESLKGQNTPLKVDKALSDIRIKFSQKLPVQDQQALTQLDRDFGVLMNSLRGENYKTLNKLSPGLGDMLAEAKGEYADASKVISPMSKVMRSRTQKPEAIMGDILSQGSEGVKALLDDLTPSERQAFQKEFARFILEESKGAQGPSGKQIKNLLTKKFKDIAPIVGGKGIENLNRLADMMEAAKAGELYTQNPSGSASGALGSAHLLGLGAGTVNPATLATILAKTGVDVAYPLLGRGVQKAAGLLKRGIGKALGGVEPGKKIAGPTSSELPSILLKAIEESRQKGLLAGVR